MQANQELAKFFKILTTSVDEYNKVYVLTVQAYNYHVTAFQWHPERMKKLSVNEELSVIMHDRNTYVHGEKNNNPSKFSF
ncbi:hypothetical protein WN944_027375 [Citrus x changshan-huyou]|uniref:Glutamine amidotransferase domain-containing protein n=1 Tax=Citrus x changshan-huyou TaxID=2935761 RepID=A0AAP0Q9T7_9ROSI